MAARSLENAASTQTLNADPHSGLVFFFPELPLVCVAQLVPTAGALRPTLCNEQSQCYSYQTHTYTHTVAVDTNSYLLPTVLTT